MRLQKWFVRTLVFGSLLAMIGGVVAYQLWTDPAAVRAQVIESLQKKFPGADVTLQSAQLRLLGGIQLSELRFVRHDDLSRTDFAYVPSGIIYHDKEQLLDGVLAFRKVQLHRPRIRIIREADGKWNLSGLVKHSAVDDLLPTIVVEEGVLLFEDRTLTEELPPLELSEVQLSVINDPLAVVTVNGRGISKSLGEVEIKGTVNRYSGRMTISIQVHRAELTTETVHRIPHRLPKEMLKNLEFSASVDGRIKLDYDPREPSPLRYNASWQLTNGKFRHPSFPMPLDNIRIEARCQNGDLQLSKFSADSGPTRFTGTASTRVECPENEIKAKLRIERLGLCKDLCCLVPESVNSLYRLFNPCGMVTVEFDVQKSGGKWLRSNCELNPYEVQMSFEEFPYLVHGVNGSIKADLIDNKGTIDLASKTQDITLSGYWADIKHQTEVDLELRAKQIPIDEKVLKALPPDLEKLARSFNPKGWANLQAGIHLAPGAEQYCNEYHVQFYDSSVEWIHFPYPVQKVTGNLHIYPDHCTFPDFRGVHNGGVIQVSGQMVPGDTPPGGQPTKRLELVLTGANIGIDKELRNALKPLPNLAKAWDTMAPEGRMSFGATINRIPGKPQDLDVAVRVEGCRIVPTFFPYALSNLNGNFRYFQNRLMLDNVVAEHGKTKISIAKGHVDLSDEGAYYAHLQDLRGNPVYPDDQFVNALPPAMRDLLKSLQVNDPFAVQTELIIAQSENPTSRPDIYWNGRGWLQNAKLKLGVDVDQVSGEIGCVGRYDGEQLLGLRGNVKFEQARLFNQPFRNVSCNMQIAKKVPDVLLLNLRAPLYSGLVSGEARVEFGSTLRYEMNLTGSQIDLREFGNHNLNDKTNLKGKASTRLHLTGTGAGVNTLDGNGTVDVFGAKLYNLPFLLDLLKFLGFRWPDRTAFEEAHAGFSIHGNKVSFERLELWGNAISLTGQGDVNLDGTNVNLDFYPTWGRVEQMLPAALKNVSPLVSKSLLKIEARGKVGGKKDDLKFHKRPIPIIVDPLREIRDQLAVLRKFELKLDALKSR